MMSLDLIVPPSPYVILGCLVSGGTGPPGYGGTGSSFKLPGDMGIWSVFMLAWGWSWPMGWPCMALCMDESWGVEGFRGRPYCELAESYIVELLADQDGESGWTGV